MCVRAWIVCIYVDESWQAIDGEIVCVLFGGMGVVCEC